MKTLDKTTFVSEYAMKSFKSISVNKKVVLPNILSDKLGQTKILKKRSEISCLKICSVGRHDQKNYFDAIETIEKLVNNNVSINYDV